MNDAQAGPAAPAPVPPPARPPERPPERYGRRARAHDRRLQAPVAIALGLAAGLGVALVAWQNLGGPGISGTVTAFDTGADHVDIRFVVARDKPDNPGTCVVRARSVNGDEVGRAEVPVAPGRERITLTYHLATSGQAVTGEVYGCRYDTAP